MGDSERGHARLIEQGGLLLQTCRGMREDSRTRCEKIAERVANGPIRRNYSEIGNTYLAAARAELSYAEQEIIRR